MMSGCRTTKPETMPPIVPIHNTDSVREITKTITVFVRDTVTVEIPAQTAERTTPDSTSHLENDFAVSDARINPDGTLFHNLETKPRKMDVPFDKPIEKTETNAERIREIEKPIPVRVPVEVERKLTAWQKICIKSAPWMFIIILAGVGYRLRKPIVNLARRFIGSK